VAQVAVCSQINQKHINTVWAELRDGLGMWRVCVRKGRCIGFWWGNRKEGDHWEVLGVDVLIIFGWISRRLDVGIWTGMGWPRIEKVNGRFGCVNELSDSVK